MPLVHFFGVATRRALQCGLRVMNSPLPPPASTAIDQKVQAARAFTSKNARKRPYLLPLAQPVAANIALAWPLAAAFLLSNRRRFYGSLAGVVIAVALMQFQSSMVAGFLLSAKAPIRALNADIWVIPKAQPSFEFSSTLPRSYQALLLGQEGVKAVLPVVNGFAAVKTTANDDGGAVVRGSVALVGMPLASLDRNLNAVGTQAAHTDNLPNAILLDVIDRNLLGVQAAGVALEINGVRGVVTDFVDGYATFLGAPYAFVEIDAARRMFGLGSDAANAVAIYVATDVRPDGVSGVARAIGARFPEVDVLTAAEYESRTALFWLIRTGAGGGLLLSAVLGFVIGFIIISQTLFALTMENLKEFATLRAMGVAPSRLTLVLLLQAGVLACTGAFAGAVLGAVMVWATRAYVLGWVLLPMWLPPAVLCVALLMGALASVSSIRMLLRVQPADAFRQA